MSVRNSEIYAEAARIVEQENFCEGKHQYACDALWLQWRRDRITLEHYRSLVRTFGHWFKPERMSYDDGWYGSSRREENRGPRVIALCFAAAMAETGDI